jgi:hypothetical protein
MPENAMPVIGAAVNVAGAGSWRSIDHERHGQEF